MINLLPIENKREIRAARTNVVLVRYIAILLVAAVVLGGLIGAAYVVLNGTKQAAEVKSQENAQRLVEYQDIKTRADSFRADLATAKTVLDSGVVYSKLIYAISDTIPRNVVLDSISLSPETLGTSTPMNANAKTFTDATALRDALTANSKLFSNVQVVSIRSSSSTDASDPYPVKITLNVTINKGAIQ